MGLRILDIQQGMSNTKGFHFLLHLSLFEIGYSKALAEFAVDGVAVGEAVDVGHGGPNMSSHRSMREAGVRGSLAAQSERWPKLSQELSQDSRPRRESNGHVGNENPHDGVVSLPHMVVWLAFKSLVSTNSTTRASVRKLTNHTAFRNSGWSRFVFLLLYRAGKFVGTFS